MNKEGVEKAAHKFEDNLKDYYETPNSYSGFHGMIMRHFIDFHAQIKNESLINKIKGFFK